MKKIWIVLPVVAMLCFKVSVANAQGGVTQDGCTDSPENPTAILAVVGSLGAGATILRARYSGRWRKK
jgi:XrtJ-associated TM-motif-TM protein